MRRLITAVFVILMFVAVSGGPATGDAHANGRRSLEVVSMEGTPTSFVSLDGSGFPTLVSTIEVATTEGAVAITATIDSFFVDVLFGSSPEGTDGEHILTTETWDFGAGDTITTDTRVFISPVVVTDLCAELVPNDMVAVITGGTGRFKDARGHIQTVIDPFCFGDVGPLPVTGSVTGLIVVPAQKRPICHGVVKLETILVPQGAVSGHLGHGDSIGEC